MKKWLIVAHCMNMDGQAASHHVSDKLKYLERNNIRPFLLSAASGKRDSRYPHHQVFSPLPSGIKFEIRHFIRLRIKARFASEALLALISLMIFPFYLLEKALLPLDSQWSWFLSAYLRGRKIIKSEKIDFIYVLGGASSGFLAAHLLSGSTNIPFLAECFDPIISNDWRRSRLCFLWNKWIESLLCKRAKAVVWYTNGARDEALARNPSLGDRGHVLRPGMEPPDFSGVKYTRKEKINFSYFGGLSNERSLLDTIKTLNDLIQENPQYSKVIQLNVYGGELDDSSREFIRKKSCDFLKAHGRLEYDESSQKTGRQQVLEEMRRSDVLVLVHGIGQITKLYIPSKTYEYLWAKRPILLITPSPEEWRELLPEEEHCIIDSGDFEQLKSAILSYVNSWRKSGLRDCEVSVPFSAEDATGKIIDLASVDCFE